MDEKDIAEQAYKNGYQVAVKEFAEQLKSHYPHTPSVCATIDKVAEELIRVEQGGKV